MRWIGMFLVVFAAPAFGLDATYLKMSEPRDWSCFRRLDRWQCTRTEKGAVIGVWELRAQLVPKSQTVSADSLLRQLKQTGSVTAANGRRVAEQVRQVKRFFQGGADWVTALKWNSVQYGKATRQYLAPVATPFGTVVIAISALLDQGQVERLDRELAAAMKTVKVRPFLADYAEYLSLSEAQREAQLPRVLSGAPSRKVPVCSATRKIDMTVGLGRALMLPLRLNSVAVVHDGGSCNAATGCASVDVTPVHLPYVMTTLLVSPMMAGTSDVYLFDRWQKCRAHYQVAVADDPTRAAAPREWTRDLVRAPSGKGELDAEYARLATAVKAGRLEAGNPVSAVWLPSGASIWLSDPRVVEPVKLKAERDGSAQCALIAKRPGTTLLVVMRPGGGGHGYRISVDASGIRLQSEAVGEYVADL